MKLASSSLSVVVTTLMVLVVLALNVLPVQGKEVESVAELRKLRALGYGNGHSFGGDNGRDHPNRYNNTSVENANDADTTESALASNAVEAEITSEDDNDGMPRGLKAGIIAFLVLALAVLALTVKACKQSKKKSIPAAAATKSAAPAPIASDEEEMTDAASDSPSH